MEILQQIPLFSPSQDSLLVYFIYFIGLYHFLKFVLGFFWNIFKELAPSKSLKKKYGEKKSWAVVTGGTDGIGLGFCEVLAHYGWNVCIISRNQKKIVDVIDRLKKQTEKNPSNPQFMYIVADFKNSSKNNFMLNIKEKLENLDIAILVNNVGTSDMKNIDEWSPEEISDIINVNCTSMAGLTSVLLPSMKQRKKSAIINLSSFLGSSPAPYVSLYSATKAFNTLFSESISLEESTENIDILSVKPMFVESPLSRKTKSFTVPDRRQCARACLRELNWESQSYGYFIHRILAHLISAVPKWIVGKVTKIGASRAMIEWKMKGQ